MKTIPAFVVCGLIESGEASGSAGDASSESGVIQFCSASVVNIASPSLQHMDASHDCEQDQRQHDCVLDSGWAIVALQESDEALHGEVAA